MREALVELGELVGERGGQRVTDRGVVLLDLRELGVPERSAPPVALASQIFTAVIAAPSIDDSSTRRSALPMVVPNPRSNGCA